MRLRRRRGRFKRRIGSVDGCVCWRGWDWVLERKWGEVVVLLCCGFCFCSCHLRVNTRYHHLAPQPSPRNSSPESPAPLADKAMEVKEVDVSSDGHRISSPSY